MEEVKRPKNFIEEFIEEDNAHERAARADPVSTRRTERLPAHRSRESPRDRFWAWRSVSAASATCAYDDTNPAKEDVEYVDAIQADIKWLGFRWNEVPVRFFLL